MRLRNLTIDYDNLSNTTLYHPRNSGPHIQGSNNTKRMTAETVVHVQIGSEVSAQVLPNASNTIAHIATSTEAIGLWQEIINFITSWI